MNQFGQAARRWVSNCLRPVLARAARNYIAGVTVADALRVAERMRERGLSATLGYWDGPAEHADDVLAKYLEALGELDRSSLDAYLSIKAPSLGYCRSRLDGLLAQAARIGRRVHFDALGPDSVDVTWSLIDELRASYPNVSCTLPGRWRRSVDDAEWVVERGLTVRVVKGQFGANADTPSDLRRGYLAVVNRLAGRATHVSIATHDPALVEPALGRLLDAGTSCDLEVLFGLSWKPAVATARRLGVSARVYVPYGAAYLPYCLAEARRSPRLIGRVVADTFKATLGFVPR